MKTVELTTKEFYVFKQLTNAYFIKLITNNKVYVEAEISLLSRLGY